MNILPILFNPNEQVYASPDRYASVWDADKNDWRVYRPSIEQSEVVASRTQLLSLNPITGPTRKDEYVTAFRSFLVEMDDIPVRDQWKTAQEIGLPFTLAIFSGNKSIHFVITLDHDLPDINVYKHYAKWLVNAIPHADRNTTNPSRSLRFPGFIRKETGKEQKLIEVRRRITHDELVRFLNKYPDAQPKKRETPLDVAPIANNIKGLDTWVKVGLKNKHFDFKNGRNSGWFGVGFDFGKNAINYDSSLKAARTCFIEESDFPVQEFEAAFKGGYEHGKNWIKTMCDQDT